MYISRGISYVQNLKMWKAAAATRPQKQALSLLLGQCVPCPKQNATKVRVCRFQFDENIHMYFRKNTFIYAHDPLAMCKPGDTVLIKQLPSKLTRLISHEVLEVVFPLGDVTDPITGKKVVAGRYRDDIEADNEMFGDSESGFDYENAPPRGSQEDKRDFSHKESYVKYHEDPEDPQPYSI